MSSLNMDDIKVVHIPGPVAAHGPLDDCDAIDTARHDGGPDDSDWGPWGDC